MLRNNEKRKTEKEAEESNRKWACINKEDGGIEFCRSCELVRPTSNSLERDEGEEEEN